MTRCSCVRRAAKRYSGMPREQLPEWARNPANEHEFNLAIGILAPSRGIQPLCKDGMLVAWRGIGEPSSHVQGMG